MDAACAATCPKDRKPRPSLYKTSPRCRRGYRSNELAANELRLRIPYAEPQTEGRAKISTGVVMLTTERSVALEPDNPVADIRHRLAVTGVFHRVKALVLGHRHVA